MVERFDSSSFNKPIQRLEVCNEYPEIKQIYNILEHFFGELWEINKYSSELISGTKPLNQMYLMYGIPNKSVIVKESEGSLSIVILIAEEDDNKTDELVLSWYSKTLNIRTIIQGSTINPTEADFSDITKVREELSKFCTAQLDYSLEDMEARLPNNPEPDSPKV